MRVLLAAVPRLMPPLWFQGYEGLVEGGENVKPANWLSVSNIIQLVRRPFLPCGRVSPCGALTLSVGSTPADRAAWLCGVARC